MPTLGGRILALGKTQQVAILTLAPLALALCALASLFPQSGDDWAWGSSEGIERLHERFAGYNGRYLGNIAVLVLTRATWLTPFVVAVTVSLIVWLLVAIAGIRSPTGYLLGSALVVGMPLTYWRETVVWVSGFANYTLACVGLVVFVLTVKRDWTQPWRVPIALAIPLGLFAAAGQLFMEHVTLLVVVASLVNVVVQLRVRRKVSAVSAAWAVGAVTGAVIMFSNSAYRAAAQGEARYQGIASGGDGDTSRIRAIIDQGTGGVSQFAVTGNLVLNLTLFVILLGLAWRGSQDSGRIDRVVVSAVALAGIALIGGAVINGSVQPGFYFAGLSAWAWVPALSLLAALLLSAWRLVESSERRLMVALLTLSVLFLTVPFAIVTPYGPRTFLPGYLLMVAVALVLLADLLESPLPPPLLPRVLAGTAAAVVAVGLAGYFSVYATIDHAADRRIEKARAAAQEGRRVVKTFTLPFPNYVQNPDPYEGTLSKRFKRYYDLPPTLNIQLFDRYPNPFLPSSCEGYVAASRPCRASKPASAG